MTLRVGDRLVGVKVDSEAALARVRTLFAEWVDHTVGEVPPAFTLRLHPAATREPGEPGERGERGPVPVPQLRFGNALLARSRRADDVLVALTQVLGGVLARQDDGRVWVGLRCLVRDDHAVFLDARRPTLVGDRSLADTGITETAAWSVVVTTDASPDAATTPRETIRDAAGDTASPRETIRDAAGDTASPRETIRDAAGDTASPRETIRDAAGDTASPRETIRDAFVEVPPPLPELRWNSVGLRPPGDGWTRHRLAGIVRIDSAPSDPAPTPGALHVLCAAHHPSNSWFALTEALVVNSRVRTATDRDGARHLIRRLLDTDGNDVQPLAT